MRIAAAEVSQETDSFNRIPIRLADFQAWGLYFGRELVEKMRGFMPIGGFLEVAERPGASAEVVPVMRAWTKAGGPVERGAVDFLHDRLVSGVKAALPLDGVLLSLHGACATDGIDDVDGYLLESVRRIVGPDVPIVLPIDHHANVTRRMFEGATVMVAHETQPHRHYRTGVRAAEVLMRTLKGEIAPTGAWEKIPMIAPVDHFLTTEGPMKRWFDRARALEERPGVVSVSPCPMQPWLDAEEGGWSVLAYTDADPALAVELAAEMAETAWEMREDFWKSDRVPPRQAVRMADRAADGLVLLSDIGDISGGGSSDSTCLLGAMLEEGIGSVAYVPMLDPEATEEAFRAGTGSELTLSLGGKRDSEYNVPLHVTGRITALSEGVTITTEFGSSPLGRTALFEAGNVKIVLAETRSIGIHHPAMYTHLGLYMEDAKMAVVKTGGKFYPFDRWTKRIIRADTPGWTQSNLAAFDWKRLPRPIWPLDDLKGWRPKGRL